MYYIKTNVADTEALNCWWKGDGSGEMSRFLQSMRQVKSEKARFNCAFYVSSRVLVSAIIEWMSWLVEGNDRYLYFRCPKDDITTTNHEQQSLWSRFSNSRVGSRVAFIHHHVGLPVTVKVERDWMHDTWMSQRANKIWWYHYQPVFYYSEGNQFRLIVIFWRNGNGIGSSSFWSSRVCASGHKKKPCSRRIGHCYTTNQQTNKQRTSQPTKSCWSSRGCPMGGHKGGHHEAFNGPAEPGTYLVLSENLLLG